MNFFPRKKSKYTKFKLRAKVYSYSVKEYSKGRYMSITLYKGSKKSPELFHLLCFNEFAIQEVESLSKAKKGVINVVCSFYVVSKLKGVKVDNQLRMVKIEPTRKAIAPEPQSDKPSNLINGFKSNEEFY